MLLLLLLLLKLWCAEAVGDHVGLLAVDHEAGVHYHVEEEHESEKSMTNKKRNKY